MRLALAACSMALALVGCGVHTLAVIDGDPVTKAALDTKLESSPAAVAAFREMVTDRLIEHYARTHGIVASDAEISAREAPLKAHYAVNDGWTKYLQSLGMTEQDARDVLARRIEIDKALSDKISITDAQVVAFFEKNRASLDKPADARVRHVLVPDVTTARKVERLLKSGQSWESVAKTYSMDPGTRDKGGELGVIRRGQMVPAFEHVAFTAPLGVISSPVKSVYGYHIIQVEERHPSQPATLANTREIILDTLRQEKEAPLIQPWLDDLKAHAKITVTDPRFSV